MNVCTPVTRYSAGAAARANPPIMAPPTTKSISPIGAAGPCPFWIFLVYLNRVLFLCLCRECQRAVFVHYGIFGTDNILAVRTQNFLCCGDIEIRRYLNKGVGSLLWCVECFLLWLRCRRRIRFGRWRRVHCEA